MTKHNLELLFYLWFSFQFLHARHMYLGLAGIIEGSFLFTGCGGGGDWVLGWGGPVQIAQSGVRKE